MSIHSAEVQYGSPPIAGRRQVLLQVAQVGWLILALTSFAIFLVTLEQFRGGTQLFWLLDDTVPPTQVRAGLDQLGLSPELYGAVGIAVLFVRGVVYYLVGALVFWRKRDEPLALLVAYLLVSLPSGDTDPRVLQDMLAGQPLRATATLVVELIAFTLLMVVFLVFPDGRFRPRWTRYVAAAWFAFGFCSLMLPDSPLDTAVFSPIVLVALLPAFLVAAVAVQVWRYRQISSPSQRQQTKWFVLGIGVIFLEFAVGNALVAIAEANWPTADPGSVVRTDLLFHATHNLAFIAFPVCLGIAILRYRLWDIGTLINRALVYGSLSAILLGVYIGGVVFLQFLVQALSGESSNIAIAASTLATAALFQPLRHRLQRTIDRRFYRRKYNSARTLHAFEHGVRNETDLGRIEASLLAAVSDSVQPAHVSLWIRQRA